MEDRSQEHRKHVFAVNGASEFLDVVRLLFEDEGYNVTTTNFVPRSFDQIAALRPDALIIDVVVGKQAGWELLERLHADVTTVGIPVLVVSTDPALLGLAAGHAERYGAHRVLGKPFDLEDMLAAVRGMIGEA